MKTFQVVVRCNGKEYVYTVRAISGTQAQTEACKMCQAEHGHAAFAHSCKEV